MIMKRLTSFLTLSLICISTLYAQPDIGDPAPNFTYNVLGGGSLSLSNYAGKVVFIYFFGSQCPHCIQNGPGTESDIYQKFKSNPDFAAMGLDTWNLSASVVNSYKQTTGVTYPLLLNARQSVIDYYGNYIYDRAVVVDKNGKLVYRGNANVTGDELDKTVSAIQNALSGMSTPIGNEKKDIPTKMTLDQNYPNPFNPSTTISYTIIKPGRVTLKVYSILGAEVATLVDDYQSPGGKSVTWNISAGNGTPLSSGIYVYKLNTGGQVLIKKMALIK